MGKSYDERRAELAQKLTNEQERKRQAEAARRSAAEALLESTAWLEKK